MGIKMFFDIIFVVIKFDCVIWWEYLENVIWLVDLVYDVNISVIVLKYVMRFGK